MDRKGASALNDYLQSHAQHLRILAMARADVDDEVSIESRCFADYRYMRMGLFVVPPSCLSSFD